MRQSKMLERAAVGLILGFVGCTPATDGDALKVVIGTDHQGITEVRVRLWDGFGDPVEEYSFPVAQYGLPFSFAVVRSGADGAPPRLGIEGVAADGSVPLSREASFEWPNNPGRTMYLFLAAACETMSCDSGEFCTEHGCEPDYVANDQLVTTDDGAELNGLCQPGYAGCTAANNAIERCTRFGQPPQLEECGSDQVCLSDSLTCGPRDGTPNSTGKATLHVVVKGDGHGSVVSQNPAFDCEDNCTFEVDAGTNVHMWVEPESDSYFVGWGMTCSGSISDCQIPVHGDVWVEARFEPHGGEVFHQVELAVSGNGSGRVWLDGTNFECRSNSCWTQVREGDYITVNAEPDAGSVFDGWQATCSGVFEPYCGMEVAGSIRLEARFSSQGGDNPRFDVDGDGNPDVIYAAPGMKNDNGQIEAGRVYVRLGGSGAHHWIASSVAYIYQGAQNGEQFGRSLSVFDVNGDHTDDIVIGAPGRDNGRGAVFAIMGGQGLIGSQILDQHPEMLVGQRPNERFGTSVSARGDFDGDGQRDLLVGAPGDGTMKGRVYVFLTGDMHSGPPVASMIIEGEQNDDRFGWSVETALDLDGYAGDEFLVGAPRYRAGSMPLAGRAYLFNFDTAVTSATQAPVIITGQQMSALVGFSVTGLGDWQGDARNDWAISSHVTDEIFVFSGMPTMQHLNPSSAEWHVAGYGFFGSAIGGFEDYNGDFRPDMVVGTPIADPQPPNGSGGGAKLYLGGGPITNPALQVSGSCLSAGQCTEEGLGYTVGPVGDMDGDGTVEFAVGSAYGGASSGPIARGRILIYDVDDPGRPASMTASDALWSIEGDGETYGLCATLSGAPAYDQHILHPFP